MTVQNAVVFNIPQQLTEEQQELARSNIGAASAADLTHPVEYIRNTGTSVPTLAQVQGLIDDGKYVILQYDDGISGHTPVPMLMLTDTRGSSPHVVFGELTATGANCVTLDDNGFGTLDTTLFDTDKIEVISISNGASTLSDASTLITRLIAVGKTPLVKYDETGSGDWGYYWLGYVTSTDYVFVRTLDSGVKTVSLKVATGALTYGSVLFDTDKIETITVQHGATTWQEGPSTLTRLASVGKTPVIKYDETGTGVWGYYWLACVTATDYVFMRISLSDVQGIRVGISTGALTYSAYSFDSGKIEPLVISNAATTLTNASTILGDLATAGKIPLVKYDETGSSDWGYYWLAYVTATDYVFIRLTSTRVLTIGIAVSTGSITYQSYPIGIDLSIVGPAFSEHVDYLIGELVIHGDSLKRFSHPHPAGSWVDADAITDNVVHNLGRVKYGGEFIDTGLHATSWTVQNNALTKIDTQMPTSGVTLEIDVDLEQGEVPNFVVQLKSRNGGTWNIVAKYRVPGTSAVITTETCFYSSDAGNVIPENVPVQITCVGNCWTWAAYVDPTAVQLSSALQGTEEPTVTENPTEDM